MVQEISFKDISYVELRQPLCSSERNYMCNFGREHFEEHVRDFFFNLDPGFVPNGKTEFQDIF